MRVDSRELRRVADRLRDDVADRLRHATKIMTDDVRDHTVDSAFDEFTTAAPYRAFADAYTR